MALERERIAERAMYRLAEDELLAIYRLMSLIRRGKE
jgi:hypothetical protein